ESAFAGAHDGVSALRLAGDLVLQSQGLRRLGAARREPGGWGSSRRLAPRRVAGRERAGGSLLREARSPGQRRLGASLPSFAFGGRGPLDPLPREGGAG